MFSEILRFECRLRFRQGLVWVLFGVFALLTFGATSSDVVRIGGALGKIQRNSPYVIVNFLAIISAMAVVAITAFVTSAVQRDHELGTQSIFFSTPLKKLDYLAGRFCGALLAAMGVMLGVVVGHWLGTLMPWVDPEELGPGRPSAYLVGLLVFALPNLFLTGAMSFALAAITRRPMIAYVGILALIVGDIIGLSFLTDFEDETFASLADPFGLAAFGITTRYWTITDRNTLLIPLEGALLWNRLLWTGVGAAWLGLALWRFRMVVDPEGPVRRRLPWRRRVPASLPVSLGEQTLDSPESPLTVPRLGFAPRDRAVQWLGQLRVELFGMVRRVPFLVLLVMGILNVTVTAISVTTQFFGTSVHPTTSLMLSTIRGSFALFLIAIVTFYGAELIWRERTARVHEVFDALPIPSWIPLLAKLVALVLAQGLLLVVIMLAAIGFQLYFDYTHIELGLYLRGLFLVQFPFWVLMCVLSITIQVIVNQRYLGFAVMAVYFVSLAALPALDLQHTLYRFATTPGILYSDMNGYGHFVASSFWLDLYWALAGVLLILLAHVFWVRSNDTRVWIRMRLARQRFTRPVALVLAATLACFFATGSFIFYNTNVLNDYEPGDRVEWRRAEYEKRYKRYEALPQPKLRSVHLEADLFPATRGLDIRAELELENRSEEEISQLHVLLDPLLDPVELDIPGAELEHDDEETGYRIYHLDPAIAPGARLRVSFSGGVRHRGFVNHGSNLELVHNGTFINNIRYLPHFGYQRLMELTNPEERRDQDLPERDRMPPPDDLEARMRPYFSSDGDWIQFDAVISTSEDQIAVAPGYLQREWTEAGRRTFHYAMDAPILGFYSVLSARYTVARDQWRDVAIEVFHHEPHHYNIDRMIESVKASLAYFTENFAPYQHRQVRILEFPSYRSFAQSFPNTIPYSEALGFIAALRDEEDIDYVFYVTAHEVAHQWWGHQLVGGDVQGATLMSETLAQYSALMVMEREYGRDQMQRFMRYELNRYLSSRGGERIREMPLLFVENQPYIHYNKGSLVMYALREYVGESAVNAALRRYLEARAFQQPPLTTSLEFFEHIRAITPEHLQGILEDWFLTITLYDNRASVATAAVRDDGRFDVHLVVDAQKLRADELGHETAVALDDWIQIGVFGEEEIDGETVETTLYLELHRLVDATSEFDIVVDSRPLEAGIDPRNLLIDRIPDDNRIDVVLGEAG